MINNQELYYKSIKEIGLNTTWEKILNEDFPNEYFTEDHLGGLYEEGLAFDNKITKKEMGKYYTPDDVAAIMSKFLIELPGNNICDLCCGTGNLILSVLNELGFETAKNYLMNDHIYLYDIDITALNICVAILKNRYGNEIESHINIINKDCLFEEITFPDNAKIIANPPYGKNTNLINSQYICGSITKEMYVAFLEKILKTKLPSVVITPHSFMGGSKFSELRKEMNNCGGYIFSFDNVPGNIFNGKKFGIFNSNEANSTRAAITIINPNINHFKISKFIRFKTDEREKVLNIDFLKSLIPEKETLTSNGEIFYRLEKGTEEFVNKWCNSSKKFEELLSNTPTEFRIDFPDTCRYFTVGSTYSLSRSGKFVLYFKSKEDFYLGYAFINSSLCYYYYRMCHGGITYPITLLKTMPIFGECTNELITKCDEIISKEKEYLVYKKNAGAIQENIKFPEQYRKDLNEILLNQLNIKCDNLLDIHKNSCF